MKQLALGVEYDDDDLMDYLRDQGLHRKHVYGFIDSNEHVHQSDPDYLKLTTDAANKYLEGLNLTLRVRAVREEDGFPIWSAEQI